MAKRMQRVLVSEVGKRSLTLGYQGENDHTQVRIGCTLVYTDYPAAEVQLVVRPPVGDTYLAVVTVDGTDVVWDITASDAAHSGSGQYQLTFTVNGTEVFKSAIGSYKISSSLDEASGSAPTPQETWAEAMAAAMAKTVTPVIEASGAAQVALVEAKGDEVLDSIPADYSELTEEVSDLNLAIHAKKIDATYVSGKVWRANTNVETSGNYQYAKYQINGETEFIICGHAFDSTGKWPAVSYLNANNETIATDKITKGYYSLVTTAVPENAVYIVVNGEGPTEPTNDPTGPLIYAVSSEIVADEIAKLNADLSQKYGFVRMLSSSELLNDITAPGAYRWASTAAPSDVPCASGVLFVYGPASSSFTGKGAIVIASTGEIYVRSAISSGWLGWTKYDANESIPSAKVFDDYISVTGTVMDGYARRTDGTDTANDNYVYVQFGVTPGDKVMLTGYHYANTYPLYLVYDSNDTLLVSATYSTAGIYSLIYEIPENASYIIVNGNKASNKGGNAYPDVRILAATKNLHDSLLTDKIKRRYLFIGDSYCGGYTHGERNLGWAKYCAEYLGVTENDYVRVCEGGAKFRNYGTQFINFIPVNYPADYFTDVVLCGGYNDHNGSTDILTGMGNVCALLKEKYPYAKIYIGFIAWIKEGSGEGKEDDWQTIKADLISNILPIYQQCTKFGAAYLTNVEYWINDSGISPEDGYHPNEAGNRSLGQAIAHALLSGSAPLPHNEAYRMPAT